MSISDVSEPDIWYHSATDDKYRKIIAPNDSNVKGILNLSNHTDVLSLRGLTTNGQSVALNPSTSASIIPLGTNRLIPSSNGKIETTDNPVEKSLEQKNVPCPGHPDDVRTMVYCIQDHLKQISKSDGNLNVVDTNYQMNIDGNKTISALCLIHLFGHDLDFLKEHGDCRDSLVEYLKEEGGRIVLNVTKLLTLRGNREEDEKFNDDVYRLILSMVNFINSEEFRKASINTQRNILNHLRLFINGEINHNYDLMSRYQMLSEKNKSINDNLLYLHNVVTIRYAETGKSVEELKMIYDKLVEAIKANLDIYRRFNEQIIDLDNKIDLSYLDDKKMEDIIKTLKTKLDDLGSQKVRLDENVNKIEKYNDQLRTNIKEKTIIDLAKSIVPEKPKTNNNNALKMLYTRRS